MTLNNDLGIGRYIEIDRFSFYHLNRAPLQCPCKLKFIPTDWHGRARSEVYGRFISNGNGHFQGLCVFLGPFEVNPKVVEELIPGILGVGQVQKVLQSLLRERVTIRDMQTILETLADYGPLTKDADLLTEYVRQKLARSIVRQHETEEGELPILTLGQDIEDQMANAISETEAGSYLTIDPEMGQMILDSLNTSLAKYIQINYQPIILTSPIVRRHLRRLIERFIPNLVVLSHNEITPTANLKVLGEVGLSNDG